MRVAYVFRAMFLVVFVGAIGWHLAGCKSQDQTASVLRTLKQGQARGHLVMTTPGALSAGQQTEFFIGARGSTLTFDGNIDFSGAPDEPPAGPQ